MREERWWSTGEGGKNRIHQPQTQVSLLARMLMTATLEPPALDTSVPTGTGAGSTPAEVDGVEMVKRSRQGKDID